MNAYVDTCVLARILLNEPNPLIEWDQLSHIVISEIVFAEFDRIVDRYRLEKSLTGQEAEQTRRLCRQTLSSATIVAVSSRLIERAGEPLASVLGCLDALHLVTAVDFAQALGGPVGMATHDRRLGRAARDAGLIVVGCP